MIAAAMVFSLTVTVLLSGAAHALEKVVALCRFPRRGVWAIALLSSWILPLAMMTHARVSPLVPAVSLQSTLATSVGGGAITAPYIGTAVSASRWPARPELDEMLAIAWGLVSCGLLAVWAAAALRLTRRARGWPVIGIDGVAVYMSDVLGPAVLGYLRPRIVMPRAVLAESGIVRSIALKHEQSHIAARDPVLLLAALLLVLLAPWNIALWWQLRRLRFAIEVDCDARVLNEGVEAAAYGETLLSISQQGGFVPLGMVALTEPASQLERRVRIMMTGPVRFRKALMGLSLAVATSLILVASGLSAPAVGGYSTVLRKPPPSHAGAPPEKFAALIKERYPTLANQKVAGTPLLIALFNHDGSIARTEQDVFQGPPQAFKATKALFERFGLTPDAVGPMGVQGLEFANQTILVVYTERNDQQIPSSSNVFPDSRTIDRALTERFFPGVFDHGTAAGEGIWVLFDRQGAVLRTGQESFDPTKLIPLLESRYPGIKASEMTVTPVVDSNMHPIKILSGGELELYSVWLDVGSSQPGGQ
jgi:hypothetical protein